MKIREEVVDWLLEWDNPPVRHLTLVNLIGKPAKGTEVSESKSRLMDYSVTQGILERADKFWNDGEDRAYWKYTGKYWQMIFLGQFLAHGKDPCIAKGANAIIERRGWVSKSGGHCLTANILAAAMRLGYTDHPTVVEETEALAKRILGDEGIKCTAMDYSLLPRCYMAQPKVLLCFAQIPPEKRSPAVNSCIELLVNNMLENEVYVYVPGNLKAWQKTLEKRPKPADLPKGQTVKGWISEQRSQFLASKGLGEQQPKRGWLKFGFPLHYNSDILEATYALATLGIPMAPKLNKPLQVVNEKMTSEGTWIMENSLNGKMLVDVEEKGNPSKWLTYFAYFVLGHFDQS